LGTSTVRILVVDDYEPWRRFVRAALQKRPELQIVGEASDGLEAVQKTQELRPDMVLLDVGLPSLCGIEAARQLQRLSSESKVLFVSQESCPDVVQEALSTGACGYVVKKYASDLLSAMDTILVE
jgi:DNA-binding NarL/FixJ family response regulator